MTKPKRRKVTATLRLTAGLTAITLLTMTAATSVPLRAEEPPITIGYAAAITGMLAPYDSIPGAQCEIDRINEKGGVLGRKLELVARDMKSDAVLSATAGQELIDMGVTAILAPPTDDSAIPIAALAAPAGIPVLSVASTQVQFPAASPSNAYLVPYGDNLAAGAAAQYARSLGYDSAALLITRDIGSYGYAIPEYFADAFEHLGGKIVGRVNYNTGLSDYNAQLAEIQAMNPKPQVIVGGFITPDGGVFPRQFKAAGLDVTFMGTDGLDDPSIPEIAGPGASSVKFITHGFPADGNALEEFYADCDKRGHKRENIFFALAGEGVALIADAITRAGSAEPSAVNAALAETENFKGITAPSITYKGHAGVPIKSMAIVEIKDGKFSKVGDILPDYVPAP